MKVGDLAKDGWGNVSIILKVLKPEEDEHYGRVYVFVMKSGGDCGLPSGRKFSYNYISAKQCLTILSRA
jgi:hypothetical protein